MFNKHYILFSIHNEGMKKNMWIHNLHPGIKRLTYPACLFLLWIFNKDHCIINAFLKWKQIWSTWLKCTHLIKFNQQGQYFLWTQWFFFPWQTLPAGIYGIDTNILESNHVYFSCLQKLSNCLNAMPCYIKHLVYFLLLDQLALQNGFNVV